MTAKMGEKDNVNRLEGGIMTGRLDLVFCIVQRGRADKIIKNAMKAGAGGATTWFARGSGIREKLGLLGIAISPEKEVMMIVTPPELTEKVFAAIVSAGKLDVPGQGLAFVTEIKQLAGIFGGPDAIEEEGEPSSDT
ncbi:P-II family nitrogen regulator [bacterium]|nr:P-II family nitrogen regulator [bacterium]